MSEWSADWVEAASVAGQLVGGSHFNGSAPVCQRDSAIDLVISIGTRDELEDCFCHALNLAVSKFGVHR